MFKSENKYEYSRGTTLLEIMVVISIFVVISSVTVFNYGQFNSSMSTQNLVDDIALTVRRAQGYAIGVRGVNENFIGGYGVHFATDGLASGEEHKGSNKSFVMFAEIGKDLNYRYNASQCGTPTSSNECMEVLKIQSADEISAIRVYKMAGLVNSSGKGALDIVFNRPNPEPLFCFNNSNTQYGCDVDKIIYIEIDIKNTMGGMDTEKTIKVSNSGQISVSNKNE